MDRPTAPFRFLARPSLVAGIARLLDFGGTLSVYGAGLPADPADDGKALAADAEVLAQDGAAVCTGIPPPAVAPGRKTRRSQA